MPADRREVDAMVAAFLAKGHAIRKIPAPLPTEAADVLRYMNEQGINVKVLRVWRGFGHAKYVLDGEIVDWKRLVQLANKRRHKEFLPPFVLKRP